MLHFITFDKLLTIAKLTPMMVNTYDFFIALAQILHKKADESESIEINQSI